MRAPIRRPLPIWTNPAALDGLIAVLLAGIALLYIDATATAPGTSFGILALVTMQTLPLAWRASSPMLVLGCVLGATAIWSAAGFEDTAATMLAAPIALYSVSALLSRRISVMSAALAVAVTLVATLIAAVTTLSSIVLVTGIARLATLAAAWVWGEGARIRRAHAALLLERAGGLLRERDADARRIATEERARLARELHDVVAHHVGMIAVQAEAGPYLLAAGRDQSADAFAAIALAARQALTEMRRLLGVLRTEPSMAPVTPQPGVEGLDALLADVRRIGLAVTLSVHGVPCSLPAGVDLSVYRIIQEAMTNVCKHARAAEASVTINYRGDTLCLQVVDDGIGGIVASEGHGLIGMRERVALLGGALTVGPAQAGGFAVMATIPLPPETTAHR